MQYLELAYEIYTGWYCYAAVLYFISVVSCFLGVRALYLKRLELFKNIQQQHVMPFVSKGLVRQVVLVFAAHNALRHACKHTSVTCLPAMIIMRMVDLPLHAVIACYHCMHIVSAPAYLTCYHTERPPIACYHCMHTVAACTCKLLFHDFAGSAYHTNPQQHSTLTQQFQQPQVGHNHVDNIALRKTLPGGHISMTHTPPCTPCSVLTMMTDNMSHAVISTINAILIIRFLVGLQGLFCPFCTEERALIDKLLWKDKTWSCTYLAHHDLESVLFSVIVISGSSNIVVVVIVIVVIIVVVIVIIIIIIIIIVVIVIVIVIVVVIVVVVVVVIIIIIIIVIIIIIIVNTVDVCP